MLSTVFVYSLDFYEIYGNSFFLPLSRILSVYHFSLCLTIFNANPFRKKFQSFAFSNRHLLASILMVWLVGSFIWQNNSCFQVSRAEQCSICLRLFVYVCRNSFWQIVGIFATFAFLIFACSDRTYVKGWHSQGISWSPTFCFFLVQLLHDFILFYV